jgi:integrase
MPILKRIKTNYPGTFFIEGTSPATGKPEKIFYIRYRKAGKMIEEKAGRQFQDDMTAARAARIRAEKIEGKKLSRKEVREAVAEIRWTVDRLWQEYVAHKPDTKGWRTDRYRYQKFLQAAFGAKEPQTIAQMDVHRLRINLSKTLKPQTVKHVLQLLARIINFGMKKGLCPGLKFRIEFPKVHNLVTEDLSPDQLNALLEAIGQEEDPQAANFMRMVLFTGLRRGEIFKLTWQDLDFDRNFINLRGPKGGQDARVPMPPAARELLLNHPRTDSPYVFPGRAGGQRTRYPKGIDRIREKAGLPSDFRPCHGLRHFFASQLASSGEVDLFTLQRLLTHKSPQMTLRYSHLRDENLQRASALAGNLIAQAVNGNTQLKVVKD